MNLFSYTCRLMRRDQYSLTKIINNNFMLITTANGTNPTLSTKQAQLMGLATTEKLGNLQNG